MLAMKPWSEERRSVPAALGRHRCFRGPRVPLWFWGAPDWTAVRWRRARLLLDAPSLVAENSRSSFFFERHRRYSPF